MRNRRVANKRRGHREGEKEKKGERDISIEIGAEAEKGLLPL